MSGERRIGYCTNVHAGPNLAQTRANLQQHALAVKEQFSSDAPMGVGLWLSAAAASELISNERQLTEFAEWLREVGLLPFTLNGFPFGDFHQQVVKHRVYEPAWFEAARLDYTLDLIAILDAILPEGEVGSISTLPLCWGQPAPAAEQLSRAAQHLRQVADRLKQLEQDRGRLIRVCIEPEPGCAIGRSDELVRFFDDYLLPGGNEEAVRRHIAVCHDVCHAAVMFEPQQEVLDRYGAAGITVGKVQISSAVRVDFDSLDEMQRAAALAQLGEFAEDRYLHQTMVVEGGRSTFHEDLPRLLSAVGDSRSLPTGEWRIHFHVPIYLQEFGLLQATQTDILDCLHAAADAANVAPHFEVETYAWSVLPAELQQPRLADGIARELSWFAEQL